MKISPLTTKNVEHVSRVRAFFDGQVGLHQRLIEMATATLGRARTLYLLIALCLGWIAYNAWLFRLVGPQLDPPPFMWLQGALCFYGAVVATMVLAAQNRRNREAEQRAHLQLQLALVQEEKTTKLIALMEELRRDMPDVPPREDPSLAELLERVDPQEVIVALDDPKTVSTGRPGRLPRRR
ncbi:MAG: hypothetical protein JWN48_3973 [Myxococcaceae bacterium]|nr:hypothetical protein [Myxococcaceae bacterium]